MFGNRCDGRQLRDLDPIVQATGYIMPMRCDAQVFLDHLLDYEALARYIAEKSREGVKITFMEIMIASYVRGVSQNPEVNRFIMNRRVFGRKELTSSFTMLLDTPDGTPEETTCKIHFDPTDTIFDVSRRIKAEIENNRRPNSDDSTLKFAKVMMSVGFLPRMVVGLAKFLDNHGLLPRAVVNLSPFHTSMFITNMASIGMHRVYHHLYNFGTTGQFFSLGMPIRETGVDIHGNVIRKRALPVGITADERCCAGAVYAQLFATMRRCLANPHELETPPESVRYDKGCEYHVAKPEAAGAAVSAQA